MGWLWWLGSERYIAEPAAGPEIQTAARILKGEHRGGPSEPDTRASANLIAMILYPIVNIYKICATMFNGIILVKERI